MHLSIVREGLYSSFAQNNLIPAQYFRDEARIDKYLAINTFLRDINNERVGDKEVGPVPEGAVDEPVEPRNATYKANFASLKNLVLLRFRCVFSTSSFRLRQPF
jgi:palmitoyl-protein thioesterase